MKLKIDFVTNSSSSNFLIVGINNRQLLEELIIKLNINLKDFTYGTIETDSKITFYDSDDYGICAGINIEKELVTKNLDMLRLEFLNYLKTQFNINTTLYDVKLMFGSAGY